MYFQFYSLPPKDSGYQHVASKIVGIEVQQRCFYAQLSNLQYSHVALVCEIVAVRNHQRPGVARRGYGTTVPLQCRTTINQPAVLPGKLAGLQHTSHCCQAELHLLRGLQCRLHAAGSEAAASPPSCGRKGIVAARSVYQPHFRCTRNCKENKIHFMTKSDSTHGPIHQCISNSCTLVFSSRRIHIS